MSLKKFVKKVTHNATHDVLGIEKIKESFSGKNHKDPFAAIASMSPGTRGLDQTLKAIGIKNGVTSAPDTVNKVFSPVDRAIHEIDPVTRYLRREVPFYRTLTDYTAQKPGSVVGAAVTGASFAGAGAGGAGAGSGGGGGGLTAGADGLGATAGGGGAAGGGAGLTSATGDVTGGGALIGGGGGAAGGSSWVPYAIQGGTGLLAAGGQIYAGNKQAKADGRALDEVRRQYDLNRNDLAPWRGKGLGGLNDIGSVLGIGPNGEQVAPDMSRFTMSPDYEFTRNENLRGIENSAAAGGGLYSGQTLKALQQRGNDLASGEFTNFLNRRLALAGLGQTATNTGVASGDSSAQTIAQLLRSQGDARASGIAGAANTIANTGGQLGGMYYGRRYPAYGYGG